jgi:VanZ family protein
MMALIFIASGTPGNELPKFGIVDLVVKKGGHALGYAMLAVAYHLAAYGGNRNRMRSTVLALCLAITYAASDEYHQLFTPGRSPSVMDVGVDSCGALAGVTILNLVIGRRGRHEQRGRQMRHLHGKGDAA